MSFLDILNSYGEEAIVFRGDNNFSVKIFVQPVMSRHSDNEKTFTRLGEADRAKYYYFGPPDVEICADEDMYVTCGEVSYDFVKAECYKVLGRASHWEAVLRLREGGDR